MNESQIDRRMFLGMARESIETMRDFLGAQASPLPRLADAHQAAQSIKRAASDPTVDSFRLIGGRLGDVFQRHLHAQTPPSQIELETIELAVDWLAQLSILYEERLPEPKTLVSELLYTFELVERSQEAVSLAELLSAHSERDMDLFREDPGFAVEEFTAPSRRDPFAEDPGFGMEFDLLQRTLNFAAVPRAIKADPFNDDPGLNVADDEASVRKGTRDKDLPYDVFSGDPPILGGSEDND